MLTNVTFQYPVEFLPVSEADGIMSVKGAGWFVSLLQRVADMWIDERLCQEDWGVVAFVRRNGKKFWIGLSMWPEGENAWLAHVHHGSFSWLQRLSRSGNQELQRLISDLHDVLASDPLVTTIVWYREGEMTHPEPRGFPSPVEV